MVTSAGSNSNTKRLLVFMIVWLFRSAIKFEEIRMNNHSFNLQQKVCRPQIFISSVIYGDLRLNREGAGAERKRKEFLA